MLNEKKIEEIRKNIQTSTLLTDHEKSDWLNLLELMNDKQLGELEEILSSGTPKPIISQPAPVQKMPPLTHIANIPTDISMSHTPISTPPPIPVNPVPLVKPQPTPKPDTQEDIMKVAHSPVTLPRLTPEKPEDVQQFSLETLRTYDLQSVVDAVRGLIQEHGYFKIVQFLEASPLYDSYINSGKERLRSTTNKPVSSNSMLTQEELEFMTDLLRHMRFNRW